MTPDPPGPPATTWRPPGERRVHTCPQPAHTDVAARRKDEQPWLRSSRSWGASPSSPAPTSTHSWTEPRTRRRCSTSWCRDYTASIAEARDAVAQTIGNLRLAEKDHDADVAEAKDWGNKALAASRKADQLRAGGDTAGADKWDSLAKIALTKQITAENEAKAA